jgi:hypothetical protein
MTGTSRHQAQPLRLGLLRQEGIETHAARDKNPCYRVCSMLPLHEPVYDLLSSNLRKAKWIICKLVFSFRSQFFHSRRHFSSHVERVLSITAEGGWIHQRFDDLIKLHNGTWPSMCENHRQRIFVSRPDLDEVHAKSIQLGPELR